MKGFENFDHTGMNFISKSEWKVILNHWSKLLPNHPAVGQASAHYDDAVGIALFQEMKSQNHGMQMATSSLALPLEQGVYYNTG